MNRIFKLFCVSVAVASTLTTAAMEAGHPQELQDRLAAPWRR